MKFHFIHTNFNVLDLKKSMDFYEKALGLKEVRRIDGDGFTIVYLGAKRLFKNFMSRPTS